MKTNTQCHVTPSWYGDLLKYRHSGATLVSDSDSDRVGPWTKGYLRTTIDESGQVSNREGLLSCLMSAEKWWWRWDGVMEGVLPGVGVHNSHLYSQSTSTGDEGHLRVGASIVRGRVPLEGGWEGYEVHHSWVQWHCGDICVLRCGK